MRALAIILSTTAFAATADAKELVYKWEKGKTHRFVAKSDDTVSMSGMGLNVKQRFFTDSTFALSIDKVKKDGSAEGTLFIESFTVKSEDGATLASLDAIPASALKNLVEVTKKGAFVFKEEIYLIVDDEGENMLVSASASPNSASATAQHGGQEVTTWASFDPKTGQLSGGYSVKEIGKKKKKVKVRSDKAKVDVLPKMFMELLRLPDGAVASGDGAIAIAHPNLSSDTKMSARVLEETASRVKIQTTFASNTETNTPTGDDDDDDQPADDNGMGAMGMPVGMEIPGMAGMPGMGGGKGKAGGSKGVSMGMNVVGDATIEMNPTEGTLDRVSGTIETKTSAAGMMNVENKTKLELVRKR